ncbi:MAG: hypothetical protein ABJP02_12515 [Parasphingorhabdus sp.]
MHKIFLLTTLPLVAAANPAHAAPLNSECKDHVENIDLDKTVKPTVRSLGSEPPAAQIAAVDRRIDNCSVLVVINPQLAGEPRWTAPTESPAAEKYHTFAD